MPLIPRIGSGTIRGGVPCGWLWLVGRTGSRTRTAGPGESGIRAGECLGRQSDLRAQAGAEHVLGEATQSGHCAFPREQLAISTNPHGKNWVGACRSPERTLSLQRRDFWLGPGRLIAQNITVFRRGRDMTTPWSRMTDIVFAVLHPMNVILDGLDSSVSLPGSARPLLRAFRRLGRCSGGYESVGHRSAQGVATTPSARMMPPWRLSAAANAVSWTGPRAVVERPCL